MSYTIMLDAIHSDAGNVPAGTPKVAGYVTGTSDIEWTPQDWERFPSSGKIRIDQSEGLVTWAAGGADVADVENGAGTQATAIAGALKRKAKGWGSWIYVAQGNFSVLQEAVNAAGLSGSVQFWVANWNLDEAEAAAALSGDIIAVQWASPSSNPLTIVPGGSKTLSEANIDLSVTAPSWFKYVAPVATAGVVVTSELKTYAATSSDGITWKTGGV
jgi:hypothetical protein